jgi:hypothetical protein
MQADIIISIAVTVAIVLIVNQFGRVLRAMMLHRTIRKGMIHGSNVTPELLEKIDEPKSGGTGGDDRTGLVLMAIGLAILGYGVLAVDIEDFSELAGMALFPLFVGAVLFGRDWFRRRSAAAE